MSDIRLDDGPDGQAEGWLTIETNVLNVLGSDLILDSPGRRQNKSRFRRALVHDQSDGISINFGDDYPGGVTIERAQIRLKPIEQDSVSHPKLPMAGRVGDLALVHSLVSPVAGELKPQEGEQVALWICVGLARGIAQWQMVSLGKTVAGSL